MRGIVYAFIFIAVAGVLMSREIGKAFTKPGDRGAVATTSAPRQASPPPQQKQQQQVSSGFRKVSLQGDRSGHFHADARINGSDIGFVVDTGATKVVIRESSAAQLGIFPRPSDYTGTTSTANGTAKYAPVRLGRVEVEGITVYDVDAAVMPDEALSVNLLGMTFLSRVKFSQDQGRLVLEQ